MALVVFLRGVNVGGHRTFRPTALVDKFKYFDVLNVGAAGTFVIRRPVTQARLRTELARRLPFEAEIMICYGSEIVRLMSESHFAHVPMRSDIVRFVSILGKSPRSAPPIPMRLPSTGKWLVKILARDGRFILGAYRRHMKVISYLGKLDRFIGVPLTTRNWSTITAVARALCSASHYRTPKNEKKAQPVARANAHSRHAAC